MAFGSPFVTWPPWGSTIWMTEARRILKSFHIMLTWYYRAGISLECMCLAPTHGRDTQLCSQCWLFIHRRLSRYLSRHFASIRRGLLAIYIDGERAAERWSYVLQHSNLSLPLGVTCCPHHPLLQSSQSLLLLPSAPGYQIKCSSHPAVSQFTSAVQITRFFLLG